MKKIKLFETLNSLQEMQIIESKEGDSLMHLEGVFGVCGVLNNNNRIYTKENYSEMVESVQDKIDKHSLLGTLEHDFTLNTNLNNVSHRVDSLSIDEDGVVHGSLTILNTPKGQIAKAIIEAGSPLYVSSKAVGTIDEDNVVTLTKLFGYDLVGSPGFSEAEVNLKENEMIESLDDNIYFVSEKEDEKEEPEPEEKDKEEEEPKTEEKDDEKEPEPEPEPEKDDDKKDDEEDDKKEENLEQKEEEQEQIKEDTNKYIYKNTMKKISLSEIILAKKNGEQLSESLVETLNETKENLKSATNMNVEGYAIPFNLLEADGDAEPILSPVAIAQPNPVDNIGALNATITDINGKSTIHTEYQSMLAPIFSNNVLSAFDLMTGLRGNVEIPRYGGVSAYWKGELKKAGESTMKFDAIEVKPKRLTVFVDLSNQLLMQSAYNVEAYVREQMILAISRKLQETILGDGAGDDVTPAGLFYGAETLDALTYANLVDIEKDAEEQNVTGNLGYIINPAIKAAARTTLKSNVAGAQYLYDNAELIGQPTWVTNDAAGLLFGDLKQVLICVWGNGIDMKVDTTTLAQYDATRLVVNFYVDVVNRAPLTGEAEDATPVKNIFPFIMGE